MTPADTAEHFEREYGCTTVEWLRWLPGAVRDCPWHLDGSNSARTDLGSGHLALRWMVLSPRRIALITLPRLRVQFDFIDSHADGRRAFMRYFDLYMQRGGG